MTRPPAIRLLGPVAIGPGTPPVDLGGPRQRAVLAILAARTGTTCTLDRLIDDLWGETTPGNPRHTVQTYVSNLRRLLATLDSDVSIERDGAGYRLVAEDDSVDLLVFERALRSADNAIDPRAELDHLRAAGAVFVGTPFSNIAEVPVLDALASRLVDRHIDAAERRIELELELGARRASELVDELGALTAAYPWRVRLWELLIEAHGRSGGSAAAARAAERARAGLAGEGIAPPPTFTAVADQLTPGADRSARADRRSVALPGPVHRHTSGAFVGRQSELGHLQAAHESAQHQLRVAVVTGEAGIGKTRLAAEFCRRAHSLGATVLFGRSDEQPVVSFQPIIEALDLLADELGDDAVAALAGPHSGELARLSARFGEPPPPVDTGRQQFLLGTALAALIAGLDDGTPPVIVIDDAQWADAPTLGALTTIARTHPELRALVVVTVRSGPQTAPDALRAAFVTLRRLDCIDEIRLGGLDHRELADLVGPDHADRFERYTHGNPLFVTMLAKHVTTGGPVEATGPISDFVVDRVRRLGSAATATLQHAAVIGPQFDITLLRSAEPEFDAHLDTLLDAIVGAELIRPVQGADGRPSSCYEFTHAIVRDALYRSITELRRASMHADVAAALAATTRSDAHRLAEIAHHWAEAVPIGHAAEAIGAARTAAVAARRTGSAAMARRLLTRAVTIVTAEPSATAPRARAELLVELAEAHRATGASTDCLRAALMAADLAANTDDDDLVIRAALATTGGDDFAGPELASSARALIGAALERSPTGGYEWAELTSKSIYLRLFERPMSELAMEFEPVLEQLERGAPADVIRRTVENGSAVVTGERHDRCVELLGRAVDPGDPDSSMPYYYERLISALGHGDGADFRAVVDEYVEVSRGNVLHHHAAAGARAVVMAWDGRMRDAARSARASTEELAEHRPIGAAAGVAAWSAVRAYLAARPHVLVSGAGRLAEQHRSAVIDSVRCWAEASIGRPDRVIRRARRRSDAHARALTAAHIGGSAFWPFVLAAIESEDPTALSYADDLVGSIDVGVVHGLPHVPTPALAHVRTLLDVARGELDAAVEAGRQAVSDYERLTAQIFLPVAQADLAAALRRRSGSGDVAEADELAALATAGAKRFRLRLPLVTLERRDSR